MSALFKFKKGQPVPQWVQSVTVDGERVDGHLHFVTCGKLAVIDGNVYIWPAKKHFLHVMRLSNLCDAHLDGSGSQGVGTICMSGYVMTKGRYWNPSKVIKSYMPASFKNSVHAKTLPDYFDRASTVIKKEPTL